MAVRPTASTSSVGRPRTRSQSVHLSTRIPVASKVASPKAKFIHKTQLKGKGKGKGKSTKKKSGKVTVVVSSDSEDSEVDFPHHPPNQPQDVPTEQPQEANPPVNIQAEEHQEQNHPQDTLAEDPEGQQQPVNVPAEGAEEPQEPNNPNPLPQHPPIPMANNQLNWSHFRPEFSGKPEEDVKVHMLRTNDWMTTHDFPENQKVRRFCLTLTQEARSWYETLNIQQQQLN